MKITQKLSLTAVAVTLAACASTTIDNKVEFQTNPIYKQQLVKAEIMPSKEELAGTTLSVVVLPTQTKNDLAKSTSAGSAIRDIVENMLQKSGLKIIDRKLASKVKNELIIHESTGNHNSSAINVADVALSPTISSAKFSSNFTEAHYAKDIISGKQVKVSASCRYKAVVAGYVKNYNLPELDLKSQVELSGNATISKDTRNSNCPISTVERYGLIEQAAENSITNYRTAIQNQFAAKSYVTEYRVMNENHFIRINHGLDKKIQQGANIQFIHQVTTTDDLTGNVSKDKFLVGEGEVTDIIQQESAWVAVDKEIAQKLQLGDIAVVKYKTSWMEDMRSVQQTIGNINL